MSWADTNCVFFFQAEDGIRDVAVTGVQTCALPIFTPPPTTIRCFGTSGMMSAPMFESTRSSSNLRNGSSIGTRSEEHTSELQSRLHLVCRLLLEKKKHDQGVDALVLASPMALEFVD